jgi:tRNA A37 threonylcarbamoyladenosine dehydratase
MKITAETIAKRKEEVMLKEYKAESFECFVREKKMDYTKSALHNYYQNPTGWIVKRR